mgnify:CR=1 FL=1
MFLQFSAILSKLLKLFNFSTAEKISEQASKLTSVNLRKGLVTLSIWYWILQIS